MESALLDKLEDAAIALNGLLDTLELAGIAVDSFGQLVFDPKEYQFCDDEKIREILEELQGLFA